MDYGRIAKNLEFIKEHPEYDELPASISEFLGPEYLNLDKSIRPGLREALVEIFGEEYNPKRISNYERAMLTGAIGIGKGHTPDTPLLTPIGWKPLKDIELGDSVIGSDGQATEVTGIFPRGKLQTYTVTFNDGASVVVDADHLWNVQSPTQKLRSNVWSTVSTADLQSAGVKTTRGQRKWHIPVVESVEFETNYEPQIAPYLLGALIGDGGLTNSSPIISSADNEILERVHSESGLELVYKGQYDYAITTGRRGGIPGGNWLTNELRKLGLMGHGAHDKFIPKEYLFLSIEERLDLLRGIMDTDGYILPHGSVQLGTASSQLATDVQDLVRSLGGIARRTLKKISGYRDCHLLTINMKQNPFWLKRKASRWAPFDKYKPARMIESIVPSGEDDIICISVKAHNQLYVTKDYIVTHNTTFASIAIPYMVHVTLCLANPQEFYGLMPGSRIAFMQMSTSAKQALEVMFGDLKGRIDNSPWFINNYPYDDKFTKQMRFPKNIWILPGGSEETTFEGYNILGGILDEMDSHKISENKDYADVGFDTIHSRIASRFTDFSDPDDMGHRGLLICIGQMKKATGFANRKYKQFLKDPKAYVKRQTIWESYGWERYTRADGTRASFWYNIKNKKIVPTLLAEKMDNKDVIEIPNAYRTDFENQPEKALKDLAGIPPESEDAFISLVDRVEACRDRWVARVGHTSPVKSDPTRIHFEDWFHGGTPIRHHLHIDFAKSSEGDALGMAFGHIEEMIEIDGERKPYIIIDALMRVKASSGTEVEFQEIRNVIYRLKEDLRFRITSVTMDGYQSTDTYQQLRKRRFKAEELSVDKSYLPYEDLRDAIYERRLEFPEYMTYARKGDTNEVEIAIQELLQLRDTGKKIDHPPDGSKDVADAMAGVVTSLMGDRSYRRGVTSRSATTGFMPDEDDALGATGTEGSGGRVLPFPSQGGMRAPLPPSVGGVMGLTIPPRLRPPGAK